MGREPLQKDDTGSSFRGTSRSACTLSTTAGSAANAVTEPRKATIKALAKPIIQMLLHERVILQMWVRSANPIDFLNLARGKVLPRIETPASFEKPLTPQNLMYAGNASAKLVGGIEDCSVRVCDLLGESQQFAWNDIGMTFHQRQVRNRSLCPHCPLPQ